MGSGKQKTDAAARRARRAHTPPTFHAYSPDDFAAVMELKSAVKDIDSGAGVAAAERADFVEVLERMARDMGAGRSGRVVQVHRFRAKMYVDDHLAGDTDEVRAVFAEYWPALADARLAPGAVAVSPGIDGAFAELFLATYSAVWNRALSHRVASTYGLYSPGDEFRVMAAFVGGYLERQPDKGRSVRAALASSLAAEYGYDAETVEAIMRQTDVVAWRLVATAAGLLFGDEAGTVVAADTGGKASSLGPIREDDTASVAGLTPRAALKTWYHHIEDSGVESQWWGDITDED